jgi:hypothetical protein
MYCSRIDFKLTGQRGGIGILLLADSLIHMHEPAQQWA